MLMWCSTPSGAVSSVNGCQLVANVNGCQLVASVNWMSGALELHADVLLQRGWLGLRRRLSP